MIISPPFLSPGGDTSDDDVWLDTMLVAPASRVATTTAPEGAFPLSHALAWHNGMHLQGSVAASGKTPVRAVADGKVVFVAEPTPPNTDVDDAQNYTPFVGGGSWTDNGCIILEHATEIGASGTQATEFTYYSLYMHLAEIAYYAPGQTRASSLKTGDRVWRKDVIGNAGQIYGHGGQLHFEICLDEPNLKKLIGRAPAWADPANPVAPAADGRTDAVFGAVWIYLPATTPTQATPPTCHLRETAPETTLGQAGWVKLNYGRGDCTLTTQDIHGAVWGRRSDTEGEYTLHTEAQHRHSALPTATQALSSPSGWYELLRFGRNLGRGTSATDKDLLPENAAHWRRIVGPEGEYIWADLNAEGSYKFSEADFLPIQGWNFVNDDSRPDDQRCDSNNLKNLIADPDLEAPDRLEPNALARRLGDPAVAKRLRRMVCQFPSEWDQTTIATRYAFVKEVGAFQDNPEAWSALEKHLKAISFANLPAAYKSANWRFHPREFIGVMRQCGWLSKGEFVQLIPDHALRTGSKKNPKTGKSETVVYWDEIPARNSDEERNPVLKNHRIPLNRMMRKYGIDTPLRKACFLGNAIQESTWLSVLAEGGGSSYWYAPWYGRGFLQLTHPGNYFDYWAWRGRAVNGTLRKAIVDAHAVIAKKAPGERDNASIQDSKFSGLTAEMIGWRENVEGQPLPPVGEALLAPSDSAGFYWIKNLMAKYADQTHSIERHSVITDANENKVYYRSLAFWKASAAVNLPARIGSTNYEGLNGFDSRCSAYGVLLAVLTEVRFPDEKGVADMEYPEGYQRRKGK